MIKIIKAEERHISDICKLWLEFMRFSEDIDPIFAPCDGAIPVFEKQELRPIMKSENNLVLVAIDGEKVVGYSFSLINKTSGLEKRKKFGYVHDLFITKSYRRRGIGEKMYAEILKWFHSKDINRVELQVIVKNQMANSFWRKQGYMDFQNTLYKKI
jgi:ribosomal protein S18 acetylase RimI-like enzyme